MPDERLLREIGTRLVTAVKQRIEEVRAEVRAATMPDVETQPAEEASPLARIEEQKRRTGSHII